VLFSDGAGFGCDSITNFHNHHKWAENNPHGVLQSKLQQNFSINVWALTLGDRSLSLDVLPCHLTGNHY
jgi:hypothetical protein